MRRSRVSLVVLASCGLALWSATAGQAQQVPSVTLKSKAELVLVPTLVTEQGKPVRGLTAQDFILLHDGQAENIAVFEEVEAVPASVQRPTLPPHTVQNYASADSHQDVVILLLDFLNASWSTRARILSYLSSDLARQFADARIPISVLLLSSNGLVEAHSFTSDPEDLVKGVQQWSAKLPYRMPVVFSSWTDPTAPTTPLWTATALRRSIAADNVIAGPWRRAIQEAAAVNTADAIQQIAEAYRGVPGRKKLIWISTGFPMAFVPGGEAPEASIASTEFHIHDQVTRAWKSLSDANIVVYPIDSNGVTAPDLGLRPKGVTGPMDPPPLTEEMPTSQGSLMEVAQKTGGLFCTDLVARCVTYAQADAPHYYVLGFYLHGQNKPGWHKIRVKVNRADGTVRNRDGFVLGDSTPLKEAAEKDVVLAALTSPLDYTSIPMQLQWSRRPGQSDKVEIALEVSCPPGAITLQSGEQTMNVDFLAFVRPMGKTEGRTFPKSFVAKLPPQQLAKFATSGFAFRKQVTVTPGRYELRVLLRDNVGHKMGTVSTLVDLTGPRPPRQ